LYESSDITPDAISSEQLSKNSTLIVTAKDKITDDASTTTPEREFPHLSSDLHENNSLAEADDESYSNHSFDLSNSDFRDKLMDVVEVILSVDSRLKSVEEKFNYTSSPEQHNDVDKEPGRKAKADKEPERKAKADDELEQKTKDGGVKPLESQPCVSQIKVFDWYNFKYKWCDDKRYAIEVLKGPAKYYQDARKEHQKYEKSKKTGNTPVRSPSDPEQDTLSPQDIPERIRIVSSPLIAIITELDPVVFDLDLTPGVMLRPYRRLARMEDDLMKHLAGLETKWGVAE
jgi:hypothetical protein